MKFVRLESFKRIPAKVSIFLFFLVFFVVDENEVSNASTKMRNFPPFYQISLHQKHVSNVQRGFPPKMKTIPRSALPAVLVRTKMKRVETNASSVPWGHS